MSTNYDSTQDTLDHINRVRQLLWGIENRLHQRARFHDQSKLEEPEKSAFDRLTPKLKELTYGSQEYRDCLKEMKPAIDHHYQANPHHPEHYAEGIDGMTLLDLVEMFADWKAATERMKDGNLKTSIEKNIERFKISEQLGKILDNTRLEMGW